MPTTSMQPTAEAMVHFIGAGPGDPELVTLKARRLIESAGVIIYAGSLVNPAVLSHARPGAEIHNSATMKLSAQVEVMRQAVAQGRSVARLHTGDPALYGAILEQMRELDRLSIRYAVVPGVSSAFAAAAALGIEYTVPGETQTVIFTRVGGLTAVPESERLRDLAAHRSSLVLFLSAGMVARVVDELLAAGYSPHTPVAVVSRASWPDELVVRGTLASIVERAQSAEITHQALIVVSPALRPEATEPADSHDSALYGTALDQPQRQATFAIVALTHGGSQIAARLHSLLSESILYIPERFSTTGMKGQVDVVPFATSVRQVLQSAFARHMALIAIMSTGIVMRDLAPLLHSKHADPAVVVMDERGQHAVSLLSGHRGGGNELARHVATLLGGTAVITTSSDVQELPALDLLGRQAGWKLAPGDAMTAVSAALVNGEPVGVVQEIGDETWWPAPLPPNLTRYETFAALAAAAPAAAMLITHHRPSGAVPEIIPSLVVYHPPCLVLGIGCNRGTPAAEILSAVDATLGEAGLAPESTYMVATVEDKAGEPGLLAACRERGWRLQAFSREALIAAGQPPNPSPYAIKALGVPGVAEPAAMLGAGVATLTVEKHKFPNVTVSVAVAPAEGRQPAAGRSVDLRLDEDRTQAGASGSIAVVGIGPGDLDHLTPAARQAIETADILVGYRMYLDFVAGLAPTVQREASGMRQEVGRVQRAVDLARQGKRVALVSSGDSGIYGMSGLLYEVLQRQSDVEIDVEVVPGVSALNAAASLLGAPLMTDFAAVSLSDHLVPLQDILRRVELAAQADFVLCLYNPKGRHRIRPFELACEALSRHRSPDTPVGIVRSAYRPDQRVEIVRLSELPAANIDMVTIVIVGNSRTEVHDGKMVTPRGYAGKYDLAGDEETSNDVATRN